MTEAGKSNYPVATPMAAQLTEEVVRDIAKLLETRGFPPFSDEDIGRLHLLPYDLLYEGHEDSPNRPSTSSQLYEFEGDDLRFL